MTKKQHYMTYPERVRLEEKLLFKVPVAQIAQELGFCKQAIYNEIERGTYLHTVEWWEEERYSADKGQDVHDKAQRNKTGRDLKIGKDRAYADFLEEKMLREKYSPAAALESARRENFETTICVSTLYNYINMGLFIELTDEDLPEKTKRKPKTERKESRVAHPELPSIVDRPEAVNRRSEFGHWEMDLVVGPQEGSGTVLLTLTERKTRQEMIFKLPDKKAVSVRRVFNRLERKLGKQHFRKIFRSITTDNGSEFLQYDKLVKSIYGGKRFDVWYCHSYAAWEKGTNENHNRMIRRWFPKGTDFGKVKSAEIAALQDWMNGYPRKILDWKTPVEAAS